MIFDPYERKGRVSFAPFFPPSLVLGDRMNLSGGCFHLIIPISIVSIKGTATNGGKAILK